MRTSKVDKLGRIVLPSEYRKRLGLFTNAEIEINLIGKEIRIRALCEICPLCGFEKDKGEMLCKDCLNKIVKEEL